MGVYIKGMDMPQDGGMLCINIYPDGKVCINLDLECKQIATAVPVPPHGDLIDRSALMVELMDRGIEGIQTDDWHEIQQSIMDAPTIIHAEEVV